MQILENLELLCYNCYYLYIADPLTNEEKRHIEDNLEVRNNPHSWGLNNLDEDILKNIESLGLNFE